MLLDYRIEGVDKMKFDLSWFLTIPGLFITGGVILLIVALVFLIVGGKKGKQQKTEESEGAAPVAVGDGTVQSAMPASNSVDNVVSSVETTQAPVVADPTVGNVPTAQPVGIDSMAATSASVDVPVVSEPTAVPSVGPVESIGGVSNSAVDSSGVVLPVDSVEDPTAQPVDSFANAVNPVEVMSPVDVSAQSNVGMPGVVDNVAPSNDFSAQPAILEPVVAAPTVEPPVMNVQPVVSESVVPMASDVVVPSVPADVSVPVVEPVLPSSVDVENSVVDAPVDSAVMSNMPDVAVQPVEPSVVPDGVDPSMNVDAPAPVVAEPVIYGGASPVVTDINIDNGNHQIYGGADPLQNTQPVPTVDVPVAPVAPVVGAFPSEPVMTSPTVSEPVITEVVDNTDPSLQQSPVVTPVAPVAPAVPVVTPIQQ